MPIVREFARLTTEDVSPSLDFATISSSAFEWLIKNACGGPAGREIVRLEGPRLLRVLNYVGSIETPCGTRLEILPKHTSEPAEVDVTRELLVRMVANALRLKPRLAAMADISRFRVPLPEWLAALFLHETFALVRRGLRRRYGEVEAREPFLRGAMDIPTQIRRGPGAAHSFSIRYDEFSFDRPENRLIRSAVELILDSTKLSTSWRLARELSISMEEIPRSSDVAADLRHWSADRLMADYASLRPLCELVLTGQAPFAVAGFERGLSMLFPMERLFEAYVTASLRAALPSRFTVRAQVADRSLCMHEGEDWFKLKPDILVSDGTSRWIIDAKWKLLNGDRRAGYGLSQGDFYQLFAYGQRYLSGKGDLYLVYPKTTAFSAPLAPFHMGGGLHLYVLPFDLETCAAPFGFLPAVVARRETIT